MLRQVFKDMYVDLARAGYFLEAFGHHCVDGEFVRGTAGPDVERYILRQLKKGYLWPITAYAYRLEEDDIFDLVELLYEHVSQSSGDVEWDSQCLECGAQSFDRNAGRLEFRAAVNDILRDYDVGYELTAEGEVVSLPPAGFAELEAAALPGLVERTVTERVDEARHKFRRRGATAAERRDALRDLADVLEYLRPRAREVLAKKDERDLFELANRFGIRHLNAGQQLDYDPAIWQSWIFYHYLATIHACTRLIEREGRTDGAHDPG